MSKDQRQRQRQPPPRPGDPAYPAYVRDSFIYVIAIPVSASMIVIIELSAIHHLWIFLVMAAMLLVAYDVVAWQALMRLPKRHKSLHGCKTITFSVCSLLGPVSGVAFPGLAV